jgi:hypothetical protein
MVGSGTRPSANERALAHENPPPPLPASTKSRCSARATRFDGIRVGQLHRDSRLLDKVRVEIEGIADEVSR